MSVCWGKIRYETERDAQLALVDCVIAFNRGKTKRREHRWYACPKCRGYHLTSTSYRPEVDAR